MSINMVGTPYKDVHLLGRNNKATRTDSIKPSLFYFFLDVSIRRTSIRSISIHIWSSIYGCIRNIYN